MYSLRKCGIRCCVYFCIFKFWLPKNFSAVCFSCFLVVFGHNLLYWKFKNRYSKNPVSVTYKDINDHIYQLINTNLWFYCSGFGSQNSSKMTTFRPKVRVLWHNADLLELLNPENDWPWHCPTKYPKVKKGDVSPWCIFISEKYEMENMTRPMINMRAKVFQKWQRTDKVF